VRTSKSNPFSLQSNTTAQNADDDLLTLEFASILPFLPAEKIGVILDRKPKYYSNI
jgi:hypothetical protein